MTHAVDTAGAAAADIADRWAADPHRPRFHFLPPANWMNDPNGLIQWKGRYHMFYQHNPNGAFWGTMHWGHAVSDDLVHWEHLPIALAPTPDSVDQDGIFSGVAVNRDGVPTIIYTGVRGNIQLPCIATGDDELVRWTKYAGNPVIAAPPAELDVVAFRDHSVWREGDVWYQVIGSGIKGQGGTALLYRSPDLLSWEFVQPILVGDAESREPLWTGTMWECPDLFPLGDKHVLVVSVWHERRTHYPVRFVGSFRDHSFAPESLHLLDFGESFYAPQSLRDDAGRRIMFGWLREQRPVEQQVAAGWSGVMSLPWLLALDETGRLRYDPAPELQHLRGAHTRISDLELSPTMPDPLADTSGTALEIIAEIEPGDAAEVGIVVRRSAEGEEATRVVYRPDSGTLMIDCTRSSADPAVGRASPAEALPLAPDEPLRLHLFLDHSVLEVVANGRVLGSVRIYPTRADSDGVALHVAGGTAHLSTLDIWEMAAI